MSSPYKDFFYKFNEIHQASGKILIERRLGEFELQYDKVKTSEKVLSTILHSLYQAYQVTDYVNFRILV